MTLFGTSEQNDDTTAMNDNLTIGIHRIVYIQVHSPRDVFTVEVMDYQHVSKDRSLGTTELEIGSLLQEGDDKKVSPWVSTGRKTRNDPLKIDNKRTVKGVIAYDVEFCE